MGLYLGAAIANGADFLNWKGSGIKRTVLVLDGEMPVETMKERVQLLAQIYGAQTRLIVLNRERLAEKEMPPLDFARGQDRSAKESLCSGLARLAVLDRRSAWWLELLL
jgi:hypothetical protein